MVYYAGNILKYEILRDYPHIQAGISTRYFGNLGYKNNTYSERAHARENFFHSAGLFLRNAVFLQQTHSNNIYLATPSDRGKGVYSQKDAIPNADGLITADNKLILAIIVADCVPVYLFEPEKNVIGLIHSGREGTGKNIVGAAVELMSDEFLVNPEKIIAILGPSIRSCCYKIDTTIADQFGWQNCLEREGEIFLDIQSCIKTQLKNMRVYKIYDTGICTCCNHNFFSYRREGENFNSMIAYISMTENTA